MPHRFRRREYHSHSASPAEREQQSGEPFNNTQGSAASKLDSTLHLVEELRQHQFELLQQNEELRRTYNELNTATHRYRDLWENAPVGYLTFQRSGVIIQANLRAQRILCGQLAISSGATVQSYLTEESARVFQQHLWNVIGKGGDGAAELQVRSNSAPTWILIESSLDENGEFRSAIIDVSKQRMIEIENRTLEARLQQSQRLDMLHGLSSGIAHDFNNILQIVLAYGELMMNPKMSREKLDECLYEVLSAAKRGSELTARLLAFSRKSTLQTKVVDLNRILEGVYSVMRRTLSEEILIEANLTECPIPVRVDVTLIEQALINLCMNARDALGKGGRIELISSIGQLPASLTNGQADASKHAIIKVRDDGSGMAPEVKARIFEPFYTTKDVGRGTGLGLAIVSGIIRQHGGNIEVESGIGMVLPLPSTWRSSTKNWKRIRAKSFFQNSLGIESRKGPDRRRRVSNSPTGGTRVNRLEIRGDIGREWATGDRINRDNSRAIPAVDYRCHHAAGQW